MVAPDDSLMSWRSAARQDVYDATTRLRRELDFPYYGPRPVEWVREARDAASTVIDAATGDTWTTFCAQTVAGLQKWRERWGASEVADPDGFGCVTLDRFIASLQAVQDYDFAEACRRLDAAAQERGTAAIRSPYTLQTHVELRTPVELAAEPREIKRATEKKGFLGLDHPRILLASILTATIKVGVMDIAFELDQPLGLPNALWVTIVYLSSYAATGIALNAWRQRPQKG